MDISHSHGQYDDDPVMQKLRELYLTLIDHDGFGELRMDIRILKRGQKEVIIHCGKQYRFVVDVSRKRDQDVGQEDCLVER